MIWVFLCVYQDRIETYENRTTLLSNYCAFGDQIITIKRYMGLETNFSLPQDSCSLPWVPIQYLVHFILCKPAHLVVCAARKLIS